MTEIEKAIYDLKGMIEVQCTHGTWNYDPYMQGMANGMILALSVMDGQEPHFIEAPDVWLKDLPESERDLDDEPDEAKQSAEILQFPNEK